MWYSIWYNCPTCDIEWEQEWDCLCNDRCPKCRAEIEPSSWQEIE